MSRYQANVIAEMRFALVKSPLHGMTFRAEAVAVDADACLVSFNRFERHAEGAEQRVNVRLEPITAVEATLRVEGKRWAARLLDLSVVAVALMVPDANPFVIGEGAEVEVDARIPETPGGDGFRLRARGTIVRVLAWAGDDPNDFRVVVRLEADDALRSRMSDYIVEQQSAILVELSRAPAP